MPAWRGRAVQGAPQGASGEVQDGEQNQYRDEARCKQLDPARHFVSLAHVISLSIHYVSVKANCIESRIL